MPMRRHDPVPERLMLKQRYIRHHTICQTLREIYALTDSEDIKLKTRVAMSMAKSMHNKLKRYRAAQKDIKLKEVPDGMPIQS